MLKWTLDDVMYDRRMEATRLAKILGVSRVTVQNWKSSEQIPDFRGTHGKLEALCGALDCKLHDLIREVENGESNS